MHTTFLCASIALSQTYTQSQRDKYYTRKEQEYPLEIINDTAALLPGNKMCSGMRLITSWIHVVNQLPLIIECPGDGYCR